MIRPMILLVVVASLLVPGTSNAEPGIRFHMAGTLQGSGIPDPACSGFRYATTGPFDGTPLGSVHWRGSECVDILSNPGSFAISGAFSLNQGLLTGTYEGHEGLPDATGRVYGWGTFSITGGSDTYAGATGNGSFTVIAQPVASTAYLELMGTLGRTA